ncbi:chromate resistance protein ChrB domain-containing protein [Paracidovorax sp. MALMAid1276]|uniref:chromate resistance protein ChrB domain-containing protein n=1 Tax=Paracidovorax sp. MALMAid1276 TaxID=3411631 RepID=UPI003B9CFF03
MWSILILTLPTQPSAVRLRVWRNLKALGCAALRDGAYVLPLDHAGLLAPIADEVRAHGGTALLMTLSATDSQQREQVQALFDRTDAFAQWRESAAAVQADLPALSETEARRRLRSVGDALQALHRIDYYPNAAATQADADLAGLRQAFDACFSRGEPAPLPAHGLPQLQAQQFQNRRWATRARPWVDRLASAWLIRRFIDPGATLVWLDDPALAPDDVLGFDYDGARFTHVGALVTFEVLMASFGLDTDPRLQRMARAVHYLDVGGIPVPEAAGLEAVLAGLREVHADDDALAQAAAQVFDALHALPCQPPASASAAAPRTPATPRATP